MSGASHDVAALGQNPYLDPVRPANHATSCSWTRATEFWAHWERAANDTVALLRAEAGRDPYDRGLSNLVGELFTPKNRASGADLVVGTLTQSTARN
jgi:hypothetical protein